MSAHDPIDLLFGGMDKPGPGSQTLVLARELNVVVHAVDNHQPFLDRLVDRAEKAHVDNLIRKHCLDMAQIPRDFRDIDLLWSEGTAYSIGFSNALATWARAMAANGLVIVSELSWLKEQIPDEVAEFFQTGDPDMRSVRDNLAVAEGAGYVVLATHTLPPRAWVDGYYEVLEPRAKALLDHPDAAVRDVAAETVREIAVFHRSDDSYGYVFYLLQRA